MSATVRPVVRPMAAPVARGVPSRSGGDDIPLTNAVFFSRDGLVDTIGLSTMLLDLSGNGRHLEIVSGTGWDDWVVKAPAADATWIAADDGTFYTAGTPNEIRASRLFYNLSDKIFSGNRGLVVYATAQDSASISRISRYLDGGEADGLALSWSVDNPLVSAYGPDPVFASAGVTPKGDGMTYAQNVMPVDSEGRGVWVGPGYVAVGIPSDLTQWTATEVSVGVSAEGYSLTPSTTLDVHYIVYSRASAGDNTFSVDVKPNGYSRISFSEVVNTGAFGVFELTGDGTVINSGVTTAATFYNASIQKLSDGFYRVSVSYVNGGLHTLRLSVSPPDATLPSDKFSGNGSDGVVMRQPMLANIKYLTPYIDTSASSVTVTSAAGSSGGNGLSWLMDATILDALGGDGVNPALCTVAAVVTMGVGSGVPGTAEYPSVIDQLGSPINNVIRYGTANYIAVSRDGTTTATVQNNWTIGKQHIKIAQVDITGAQFRVGSARVGVDAAIQWGSYVNFDGSFNPSTVLMAAYNGTVPLWIKSVQVWNRPVPDATIIKWAGGIS